MQQAYFQTQSAEYIYSSKRRVCLFVCLLFVIHTALVFSCSCVRPYWFELAIWCCHMVWCIAPLPGHHYWDNDSKLQYKSTMASLLSGIFWLHFATVEQSVKYSLMWFVTTSAGELSWICFQSIRSEDDLILLLPLIHSHVTKILSHKDSSTPPPSLFFLHLHFASMFIHQPPSVFDPSYFASPNNTYICTYTQREHFVSQMFGHSVFLWKCLTS